MEALKPTWRNFFLSHTPTSMAVEMLYVSNVVDTEDDCKYKMKIFCPSCKPKTGSLINTTQAGFNL